MLARGERRDLPNGSACTQPESEAPRFNHFCFPLLQSHPGPDSTKHFKTMLDSQSGGTIVCTLQRYRDGLAYIDVKCVF